MKVLLDTCVLSEIRKSRPNSRVYSAISNISGEEIYISTITIGEITRGIELLENSKRKTSLKEWVYKMEKQYNHRIIPIDIRVSHIWGMLTAQAQKNGRTLPIADGLIAATAKYHKLCIMTRNIKDFKDLGVSIVNPWDEKF